MQKKLDAVVFIRLSDMPHHCARHDIPGGAGAIILTVSQARARRLASPHGWALREERRAQRRGAFRGENWGSKLPCSYKVPKRKDGRPDWARITVFIGGEAVEKSALRDCGACGKRFWFDAYPFQLDRGEWDFGLPEDVVTQAYNAVAYGWLRCESCRRTVSYRERTKEEAFELANELRYAGFKVVHGRAADSNAEVSWWEVFHLGLPPVVREADPLDARRRQVQMSGLGDWRLEGSTQGVALARPQAEALAAEDAEGYQAVAYEEGEALVDEDTPTDRRRNHGAQRRYAERWEAARAIELDDLSRDENGRFVTEALGSTDEAVRSWAKANAPRLRTAFRLPA